MKSRPIKEWIAAAAAGGLIAFMDFRSKSDDSHFVILALWFLGGLIFGLWRGERAGVFLLPVALTLPLIYAGRWTQGAPTTLHPNTPLTIFLISLLALTAAFLGALLGTLARKTSAPNIA